MFSTDEASNIFDEIIEAAQAVADKHGVDISRANGGTVQGQSAHFKVSVNQVSESGEAMTKEATAFKNHAPFHDLDPELLFEVVRVNGRRHKIVGFNTRAHKYPVQTECLDDGKNYKFGTGALKRAVS